MREEYPASNTLKYIGQLSQLIFLKVYDEIDKRFENIQNSIECFRLH